MDRRTKQLRGAISRLDDIFRVEPIERTPPSESAPGSALGLPGGVYHSRALPSFEVGLGDRAPSAPSSYRLPKEIDVGEVRHGGRIEEYWKGRNVDINRFHLGRHIKDLWAFDPEQFRKRFGLKSVEFGNWMSEADRMANLYACAVSFTDLAEILGITDPKLLGLGGELSIAFGARGHGGAVAHYEPGAQYRVINITKERGAGALVHEWAHAVSGMVTTALDLRDRITGGRSVRMTTDKKAIDRGGLVALMERIFDRALWRDGDASELQQRLKDKDKYYRTREEIWARIVERWTRRMLDAASKPIANHYLVVPARQMPAAIYPTAAETDRVAPYVREFLRDALSAIAAWSAGRHIPGATATVVKDKASHDAPPTAAPPAAAPPHDSPQLGAPPAEKPRRKHSHHDTPPPECPPCSVVPIDMGSTSTPRSKRSTSTPATITYGDRTSIDTPARALEARYALIDLDDLITSHDPISFAEDPRYPTGCQQRDYRRIQGEQSKVMHAAANLMPRYLVTDTPSPTDGPPIVTPAGIVLGGNGRTMALKRSPHHDRYVEYLRRAIGLYGLTTADVERYKRPALVRVVDVDMTQCAMLSNVLNTSRQQQLDTRTETLSYVRQLAPPQLERIAAILDESDASTFAQALQSRKTVTSIIDILRAAGIITSGNADRWLTAAGELSPYGRLMLEGILLGAVLPDRELIEAARSYTDKLVRTLPLMVRMRALPAEWDLRPAIERAIRLESERRASGLDRNSFTAQQSFDRAAPSETAALVWDLLDGSLARWRSFVDRYVTQAEREIEQGGAMDFGMPAMTPAQLVQKLTAKEGAAAAGLSDASMTPVGASITSPSTSPLLRIPSVLRRLLGDVRQGFSQYIYGPPHAGKSHLAMWEAGQLQMAGPGLIVLGEERLSDGNVQRRAAKYRVNPQLVAALETRDPAVIRAAIATGKYLWCIIDSIDVIDGTDVEALKIKDAFPLVSFTWIGHSDKEQQKTSAGSRNRVHLSSIVLRVMDGTATVIKNTWQKSQGFTMKVPI